MSWTGCRASASTENDLKALVATATHGGWRDNPGSGRRSSLDSYARPNHSGGLAEVVNLIRSVVEANGMPHTPHLRALIPRSIASRRFDPKRPWLPPS